MPRYEKPYAHLPQYNHQSKYNQQALRQLLQDDGSFGSVLFFGLAQHFGPEMFQWSPDGILQITEEEFGVKMPLGCFDRLMACITISTTDMFWGDLPTFVAICNVLSGSPITEDFDPANVLEMTWAVTESGLLALDPGETHPFSDDIKHYIVKACQEEGLLTPPPILANLTTGMIDASGSDFSSEPDMYQAVWYNQQSSLIDTQLEVQRNLWKLYQQLKSLELSEAIDKKLTEAQQRTSVTINQLKVQESQLSTGQS